MTEDDALAELAALDTDSAEDRGRRDLELDHIHGDKLVEKALRELGWNRLADRYTRACDHWWYA